jgi:hypothetical protein
MPDKPTWCGFLDEIAERLGGLPDPWIDRALLEELLGGGPRRAQQILAPCVTRKVGVNGMAHRDAVIAQLQRLASGQSAHYEQQRRRLAEHLDALDAERAENRHGRRLATGTK